MADWKSKASYLTPQNVAHEVAGSPVNFWPISVSLAFKLRAIGKPLAKALTVLFSKKDTDSGSETRQVGNLYGTFDTQIISSAVSPEVLKLRLDASTQAIEDIIDAITSPENAAILGEILMDSQREIFAENPRPSPEQYIASIPVTVLPSLLTGLAKANREVLGPLASVLDLSLVQQTLKNRLGLAGNEKSEVTETAETTAPATASTPG